MEKPVEEVPNTETTTDIVNETIEETFEDDAVLPEEEMIVEVEQEEEEDEKEEEQEEVVHETEGGKMSTTLSAINEEDEYEEEANDQWLPLPGSLVDESSFGRRSSFSRPLANRRYSREEVSLDEDYSLRGDVDEDRKYYIYKVRDVNMVPKKECVGKVIVPQEMLSKRKSKVTLDDLRKLIRQSSDEALQEAAKNRFRYLSESYHLVASDESFTPVEQLYPTQGVFIKLENENPFSTRRIDNSFTSKLQAEYERKFGPIVPKKRPRKSTRWDKLSLGMSIATDDIPNENEEKEKSDPNIWDPKKMLEPRGPIRLYNKYKSMENRGGRFRDRRIDDDASSAYNNQERWPPPPPPPRMGGRSKGSRMYYHENSPQSTLTQTILL